MEQLRNELQNPNTLLQVKRSVEYGSLIIHSLETGISRIIYGNVVNEELIENLPAGCCVEVPCAVHRNGVQPIHIGKIPPHLAALMQTNINAQALTVEAIIKQDPQLIYQAAMLDPHTAAELDLDRIWALVDDLIAANGEWIPKPLRTNSREIPATTDRTGVAVT